MAHTKMAIILDNAGEPLTCQCLGDEHDPVKEVGPGKTNPGEGGIEGKIVEVVTLTLVRTSANNPTCCWWIKLGGRWYCMPVECP